MGRHRGFNSCLAHYQLISTWMGVCSLQTPKTPTWAIWSADPRNFPRCEPAANVCDVIGYVTIGLTSMCAYQISGSVVTKWLSCTLWKYEAQNILKWQLWPSGESYDVIGHVVVQSASPFTLPQNQTESGSNNLLLKYGRLNFFKKDCSTNKGRLLVSR